MNRLKSKNSKPRVSSQSYKLYEIMEGRRYHSAILPSDGEPFEAFERIRSESGNYKLSLIEVCGGIRTEVVKAEENRRVDDFQLLAEQEYSDWEEGVSFES